MTNEPPKTDTIAASASASASASTPTSTSASASVSASAATATTTTTAPTTAAVADTSITDEAPGELTAVVDELLDSLSTKFASVSSEIFEKIEAMSKRLDSMEASLQQSSTPAPK